MFDEQARFRDELGREEYVLVPRGRRPHGPSWQRTTQVDRYVATDMLVRFASSSMPDARLLRVLGAPRLRMHSLELQQTARQAMHRLDLYRVERDRRPTHFPPQFALAPVPAVAPPPKKPTHWVGIEMVTESDAPVRFLRLELTLPDGSVRSILTGGDGTAVVEGVTAGSCSVSLPTANQAGTKR